MNKIKLSFILIVTVLLSSCSEKNTNNENTSKPKVLANKESKNIQRDVDLRAFSRGQKLYLTNCASCHGKNAEGTKDWRSSDEDGKFPAPPLNGTAHTWHHSTTVLVNTIKNGTAKIGGNMPAWKGKLSDKEILDILVWVKAQWPDEIYAIWYKNYHSEK